MSQSASAGAASASGTVSVAEPTARNLLTTALRPLEPAMEFETTVTVDGKVAVTSSGRTVGESTELRVTADGASVDYVEVPPQAWARQSAGSWVLVAIADVPRTSLAVLASPLNVRALPGGSGSLVADYPAAALGLAGDAVTVEISIGDGSVTFRYAATVSGHAARAETTMRPASNLEPIPVPSSP